MTMVTFKVTLGGGAHACPVKYRPAGGGDFTAVAPGVPVALPAGSYDIAWALFGPPGSTVSITVDGSTGAGQPFTDQLDVGDPDPKPNGNRFDVQ